MSWECKLSDFEHKDETGAIWHYPNESRLLLTLPGEHTYFALDADNGWTMTGELPKVTIRPSIRVIAPGGYHGYVTDGVLSDDLEGRQFP